MSSIGPRYTVSGVPSRVLKETSQKAGATETKVYNVSETFFKEHMGVFAKFFNFVKSFFSSSVWSRITVTDETQNMSKTAYLFKDRMAQFLKGPEAAPRSSVTTPLLASSHPPGGEPKATPKPQAAAPKPPAAAPLPAAASAHPRGGSPIVTKLAPFQPPLKAEERINLAKTTNQLVDWISKLQLPMTDRAAIAIKFEGKGLLSIEPRHGVKTSGAGIREATTPYQILQGVIAYLEKCHYISPGEIKPAPFDFKKFSDACDTGLHSINEHETKDGKDILVAMLSLGKHLSNNFELIQRTTKDVNKLFKPPAAMSSTIMEFIDKFDKYGTHYSK